MSNSTIKHILVALDATEANKSILQAANALANRLNADVQALFVEDIDLLHLAELPLAREMTYGSPTARQLTLADVEKQLKAQVERMRHYVESYGQQGNIKVSFSVTRGRIESEVCTAAELTDLLIVGKNTQLIKHSEKLGKITQGIITGAKCDVLLLQYGSEISLPVAVLYDGTEASMRALQMAIQIAKGDHDKLVVFYPTNLQQQLQPEVSKITGQVGIEPSHVQLKMDTPEGILDALADCKGRMLLLEANMKTFNREKIHSLLKQSNIPVILIR